MLIRTIIFIALLAIVPHNGNAQLCFPVQKVYAFVQPVTRGTAAKTEERDRKERANHLIYITSKKSGLKLNHVWINGELHAANLKALPSPVVIYNRLQDSSVLVPKNRHKTYQLAFSALPADASNISIPEKYANAPILLELQYKNRKKYFAVNKISELEVMPLY
jgi:hypothetical protein